LRTEKEAIENIRIPINEKKDGFKILSEKDILSWNDITLVATIKET
jgi:hypothetical protein